LDTSKTSSFHSFDVISPSELSERKDALASFLAVHPHDLGSPPFGDVERTFLFSCDYRVFNIFVELLRSIRAPGWSLTLQDCLLTSQRIFIRYFHGDNSLKCKPSVLLGIFDADFEWFQTTFSINTV